MRDEPWFYAVLRELDAFRSFQEIAEGHRRVFWSYLGVRMIEALERLETSARTLVRG